MMRERETVRAGPEVTAAAAMLVKRMRTAVAVLGVVTLSAVIASCGGGGGSDGSSVAGGGTTTGGSGGGVSSQLVSGVAATGAPLPGVVSLKDASSPSREKTTVIAADGSFAVDVSDMNAPFMLKATGTVDGVKRTMYSFAASAGTANVNPLSTAAVARAAEVDDPAQAYDSMDSATREKMKAGLPAAVAALQSQLQPLLTAFDVGKTDPIKDEFKADHNGLDAVFDNVRVALNGGTLTITNATTGAVLFTASVRDLEHGKFTDKDDDMPKRGPRPTTPTGVTATGGDGQVTVTWNAVANATSYTLYWSTKSDDDEEDDDPNKITNVTSPFVHTGLSAATTYYYRVRAINSAGKSAKSTRVSATTTSTAPAATIPAAPASISATGGTKQTTVTWSAVSGATSYNLYWSTTSGVTKANGTKISGVTSPAVHTGLTDSTTYYYIVTAVNSAGEGAASPQAAATTLGASSPPPGIPSAPTGVSATGGANQTTVSWSAVSGATSYNIYWSTTTGVTTTTGTKISGVTSPFAHTGLSPSTTYFYVVTAVNGAVESNASSQTSATTNTPAATVPAAPTGLAATGGTKQVTLTWNSVADATSYNLYWSTASGVTPGTGTKIAGATSGFIQTGLSDGTPYFYVVTAVNSAGESPASSQATATTSAAPPPVIDGAALYTAYCSGCHGALATSDKQGATADMITAGIAGVTAMRTRFNASTGTVAKLTPEQIAAIAAALQ